MTAAVGTRARARWRTAYETAQLLGISYWSMRQALADKLVHSHFTGSPGAGQHFLLIAPTRTWRRGGDLDAQREVCPCCRGLIAEPPVVMGAARKRSLRGRLPPAPV